MKYITLSEQNTGRINFSYSNFHILCTILKSNNDPNGEKFGAWETRVERWWRRGIKAEKGKTNI